MNSTNQTKVYNNLINNWSFINTGNFCQDKTLIYDHL